MAKLKYKTSDGQLLAWTRSPSLSSGAGEAVVDYDVTDPSSIQPLGHYKVDLAALPTISILSRSQAEKDSFDDDNTLATGADVQTRYDTKTNDPDRLAFLKDTMKHMFDGTATKSNISVL